jgi:hypothetical protein
MKICVNLKVNYIQMNYGRKCYLIHKKWQRKGMDFECATKKKGVLNKFLKPYFGIRNSKNCQDGEP